MWVERRPLDSRLRGNDGAEAGNDGDRSGNDGAEAGNDGDRSGNDRAEAGNDRDRRGNDGAEPETEVGGLTIRGSPWRQIKQNIDVLALLLGLYLWYRIGAKLGLDTNSLRIGG